MLPLKYVCNVSAKNLKIFLLISFKLFNQPLLLGILFYLPISPRRWSLWISHEQVLFLLVIADTFFCNRYNHFQIQAHTKLLSTLLQKIPHFYAIFFSAAHTNPKTSFFSTLQLDVHNFYILVGLYHTHLWCIWLDFCVLVMSMKGSYYCNTCLQLSCSFTHFVYRRVFTAFLPTVSLMPHFTFQAISIFE